MIAIIVIVVFSILILVHETGHLIAAKRSGIRVEAFSLGFGKRLFGVDIKGTDYRISLVPFGGYVKMAGEDPQEATGKEDEFASKPVGYRFWVISAGSLFNYIFAFILFSTVFMIGAPVLSNEIGKILEGYPAEKAGIQIGDKILEINDSPVKYWEDILEVINKEAVNDADLRLEIERGNTVTEISVKPEISEVTNIFGQKIRRPLIGIAPKDKLLNISYDPIRAFYFGGKYLINLSGMTYKGIWLLITGGLPVAKSVSGPIGIFGLMGSAASAGVVPLLLITAHISMALAIFNMLPFPILDGGHIIFLGIEKLIKRPVSPKVQEVITQVAFFILLAFFLFVSWNDILKTPLGEKLMGK